MLQGQVTESINSPPTTSGSTSLVCVCLNRLGNFLVSTYDTMIVVNAVARAPWEVVNRYEGCAHFHTLNRPMYRQNF